MARKRKSVWNAELARNVLKDYASGIATEDIALIYRVPEETVIHYLAQHGQLLETKGRHREDGYIEQVKLLQQLACGINPCTGKPLPEEIVMYPELLEALNAGAVALLEQSTPSRMNKPWKTAEEERLLDLRAQGKDNAQIAKRLRRTERAVELKAEELDERREHRYTEEEKRAAVQRVRLRSKPDEKSSWTENDLRKLRDMSTSGMDVLNIAGYFGKTIEETQREIDRLKK